MFNEIYHGLHITTLTTGTYCSHLLKVYMVLMWREGWLSVAYYNLDMTLNNLANSVYILQVYMDLMWHADRLVMAFYDLDMTLPTLSTYCRCTSA